MNIVVLGLGYVGLPLANALSKHFNVTGFDINEIRIEELKNHVDRTRELSTEELKETAIKFTSTLEDLKGNDIYIITVPTPVDESTNTPDLSLLKSASEMVAKVLCPNNIVVFESTVYPGVTEEYCGPIIEKASGLKAGKDFFLGYSPERINPGDKEHTISKITKVVAGQTPAVTEKLAHVYGSITNVFKATNIKTAEAAKVIENAQRDINIAFMNEITSIFNKGNISIFDVLNAARTKWNFLPFEPGLVGGHCIGVDPFYLAHYAETKGYHPRVILAGRHTNDSMGSLFAHFVDDHMQGHHIKNKKVLVLGLTFKENIPDLRNTKVADLITALKKLGYTVDVIDPQADMQEAKNHYNIDLKNIEEASGYGCVIGAVPHKEFKELAVQDFMSFGVAPCLIVDLKNMWSHHEAFPEEFFKVSI